MSGLFVILMICLVTFNFVYASLIGDSSTFLVNMAIGGIFTVLIGGVIAALLGSIQVLGSGLNPTGTRIIFGFAVLLGLLFQITFTVSVYEIPLGVGLLSNVFSTFQITDGYGIPFFLTSIIGLVVLVTGVQAIQGGDSGA